MTAFLSNPRLRFGLWLALAATASVGAWVLIAMNRRPADQSTGPATPGFSDSRYLNSPAAAAYIGTAACAECHVRNHQSYLLTAHSQAVAEVDPALEPPDAAYTHPASGRTYRVHRRDGKLYHEEALTAPDGRDLGRTDLPLRYRIGSGHHARAYAVEVDGFLHESPINWYTAKHKWDMAPGYDVAKPAGFERPIALECMACHAGRATETAGALNRLAISELAIGCESCHGPGSLHRDKWKGNPRRGGEDLTIVHPGRLSRPLQEAICSACHLGDPAIVAVRGRQISDFEPGRPLADFRIHYRLEGGDDSMTLVGHVDQLHLSKCYQKSELSCLTCHDPHERQKPADVAAFFREKCQTCHAACKLEAGQRLAKSPTDNCVACHMPQSPTESPHISFTHHRIGIHGIPRPPGDTGGSPELVATEDSPFLTPADRERNLGLAYLCVRRHPESAPYARDFRDRAIKHLEAAYAAGLRDPETLMGLAELCRKGEEGKARAYALDALRTPVVFPKTRVMALMAVGYTDFHAENYPEAMDRLEELVQLRRLADDWRLLGLCRLHTDEPQRALAALKQALAIRPFRPATHEALAEAYERTGDSRLAAEHRETAHRLRELKQD